MWSDPDSSWEEAETRMVHHRERLVSRGILADAIQPEWCHQNEKKMLNSQEVIFLSILVYKFDSKLADTLCIFVYCLLLHK